MQDLTPIGLYPRGEQELMRIGVGMMTSAEAKEAMRDGSAAGSHDPSRAFREAMLSPSFVK